MKLRTLSLVSLLLTLTATSLVVRGQDQPTIMKDWVTFDAFTVNHQKGNYDVWTWLPRTEFRVNGPIASGSQLYVEVGYPGAAKWVTYDCDTGETQKGYWWKVRCGGRDNIDEAKGVTYTGPVNFAIKMRNELLGGADVTLFTGKAKVAKVHSGEAGPKYVNRMVYYVDQDAFLPIGYVWMTPDDIHGWKRTTPNVAFWVRGEAYKTQPHMFYQGKEIGRQMLDGVEVGAARCDNEIEVNPSISTKPDFPQGAKWRRVVCRFFNIMGRDESGRSYGSFPPHLMGQNPGEYEFKLLWNNKLARSIKFTVKPGGSFDNGIATANKLGDDRVIFPVTVIGDQDGVWDKNAWKTDAFYGNPLAGFSVGP